MDNDQKNSKKIKINEFFNNSKKSKILNVDESISKVFYKIFSVLLKIEQLDNFISSLDLMVLGNQFKFLFDDLIKFTLSICKRYSIENYKELENKHLIEKYIECCEALNDFTYELLNKGKWFKIKIDLRYIYGLVVLCFVLLSLINELIKNNLVIKSSQFLKLLNKIDYGLIYSPPFLNNILAKIATLFHEILILEEPINENKYKLNSNLLSKNNLHISKQIERKKMLSVDDFFENYFLKNKPVVIENAINDWPALQGDNEWNLNYILKKAAHRLIPVEIGNKYTDTNWTQRVITVKEFIDEFIIQKNNKGYCAQYELFDRIHNLSNDFYIPDYCAVNVDDENSNGQNDLHINAWFGPEFTISPLHIDSKHNILAQVFGSKYIRIYSSNIPKENLYLFDSHLLKNTSKVDIENIDKEKYPNFPDNYQETILNKGDLLFIPFEYWHYVKSLTLSFSISFWWN